LTSYQKDQIARLVRRKCRPEQLPCAAFASCQNCDALSIG